MAPKRTYTRHNMSIAKPDLDPSDPENIYNDAHKRRKPTPPSMVASTHVLNGGGRSRSMNLKSATDRSQKGNSRKSFTGPITLPTNEMDLDDIETKTDSFDSALAMAQTQKAPPPPRSSIYGGGRSFINSISAQLKGRKREAKRKQAQTYVSDDSSVDGGIQLSPNGASEEIGPGLDDVDIPMEGSDAVNVLMRGGSNLSMADACARIFGGREYTSAQLPPPRRDFFGSRMSPDSILALAWSANQTNSPLLRLPASVRRSIFEYALGGNSIEFGYVTYLVEGADTVQSHYKPYFQYTSNVYNDRRNPLQGTKLFLHDDPATSGMTLLNGVCRQLYRETYTLPYSLNDFYFSSGNALFNFLVKEDRLQPQQCRVITSVVVLHKLPGPAVLQKLPGLQHVRLLVADVPIETGFYKVVREGKVPRLARCVASLANANLGNGKYGYDRRGCGFDRYKR